MYSKSSLYQYTLDIAKNNALYFKFGLPDWVENFDLVNTIIRKNSYENCVELGVHTGQSTRCILASLIQQKKGRLIAIDSDKLIENIINVDFSSSYHSILQIEKDFLDPCFVGRFLSYYMLGGMEVLALDKIRKGERLTPIELKYLNSNPKLVECTKQKEITNEDIVTLIQINPGLAVVNACKELLFSSIDLLHIDTAHTAEETYMWLNSDYIKRIRGGGCCLWHDIALSEVSIPLSIWLEDHKYEWLYYEYYLNPFGLGVMVKL